MSSFGCRRLVAELRSVFNQCSDVMKAIVRLRLPVIASVQGLATAAGCQLVASCDLAVAADHGASFSTPGVSIGLFCSTPSVALTRQIPYKAAMHMLLTADAICADKALAIGLVSEVVPDSDLESHTLSLAMRIASKSGGALDVGKAITRRHMELDLDNAYACASEAMVLNLMSTPDAREGITALLEKRQPLWDWQKSRN